MPQVPELLRSIEEKIKLLTDQHIQVKQENESLINQNTGYLETIDNQKNQIKQLEDKIQSLSIGRSNENLEQPADMKEKIAGLVREIDKCIGLLNK
jgi:chromosome segregation ATPase